jgi:hypothetical protein
MRVAGLLFVGITPFFVGSQVLGIGGWTGEPLCLRSAWRC